MGGWTACMHWRVCPKECPKQIESCEYYNPSRKKSEWLNASSGGIYCSSCGLPSSNRTKYCPNCGAEMENK